MILFTDSPAFARSIFPKSKPRTPAEAPEKLEWTRPFFNSRHIEILTVPQHEIWSFAVVTEESARSQFDILLELSRQNPDLPSGIAAITGFSNDLHGFHGRKWHALPGNLHLCVYFKPEAALRTHVLPGLIMLGTVSVLQTVDRFPAVKDKAQIRWLNDIFIGNRKLAGVLTQTQIQGNQVTGALIGIGLNVRAAPVIQSDKLIAGATCLKEFQPAIDLAQVTDLLLQKLGQNARLLNVGGYDRLFARYRQRSQVLGKRVLVYSDPSRGKSVPLRTGRVAEIQPDLSLLLQGDPDPVVNGRVDILKE